MNAVGIIAKKRDGLNLTRHEIEFFINSYIDGLITDCQTSALLMAIYLNGMDNKETAWLTDAMLNTGKTATFPLPDNLFVDKHSTGGVGDKVSLILAPLVASCGVKVPMLAGRGLGHTGGTIDKLESILGYRTDLSIEEIKDGVKKVGCVISGQTPQIAPADRRMYALRNCTATVASIPLICASILSKKFAVGPKGLVFDIKCGNGAFMKTIDEAKRLGENLIEVSKSMGKNAAALITDMNQPLGIAAGNILEVIESIDALHGKISPDLLSITLELGAEMLLLAGIQNNREKAVSLLEEKLEKGSAYARFEEMVSNQGGDISILTCPDKLQKAPAVAKFESPSDGFIQGFETAGLGRLIVDMGGGRKREDDRIDPLVGLKFFKKIGDSVSAGEALVEIHAKDKIQIKEAIKRIASLIKVGPDKIDPPLVVKERIS